MQRQGGGLKRKRYDLRHGAVDGMLVGEDSRLASVRVSRRRNVVASCAQPRTPPLGHCLYDKKQLTCDWCSACTIDARIITNAH